MRKPWQRCVGQQPYWLCHGSRISHGTGSLISWIKLDRIDLWSWLQSCPGCWRQLIKPTELCFVVCPALLKGTEKNKVLWMSNITLSKMVVIWSVVKSGKRVESLHIGLKSEVSQIGWNNLWSFEIGLPAKMFQAYLSNRPAVLCFQDIGTKRSGLKTKQSGKSLDIAQLWCG